MADHLTKQARSRNMAAVKSSHTAPEVKLRKLLHALGYRYRLHVSTLPGKPDIVFRSRRAVIFMHGCFWHRHKSCKRATEPGTNVDFWTEKFRGNMERDRRAVKELKELGYAALIVWECQLKNPTHLLPRIEKFLEANQKEHAT